MQNSLLVATSRTLSKAEWRSFRKYLSSPFFNQRADVTALAAYLQQELFKPVEAQSITKMAVWKKTSPGIGYDEKQLRYTMSYLLTSLENFLGVLEMESNTPFYKWFVFSALRKRGLEKSAETHLIAAQMLNDSNEHFDPAFNRILKRSHREMMSRMPGYVEQAMPENIKNFTLDILVETLREGCSFMDHQVSSSSNPPFPLLDAALVFCEKEQLMEHSTTLAMLYHTYRMLEQMPSGGGETHFYLIKNILNNSAGIPAALQRETWLRAINFAIRQQNLGNKRFGKEAFELYKAGMGNGLILENAQISKKAYSNTLVLALLVGEWGWAEDFLNNYKDYLPENERDNTYRHNLATLYFKQKKFGKVLETVQHVSFTDSLHNLDDRRLLLCSYFELGEWAALESLLDSFGIWLRRAKNLGYHHELYTNLVKFTRRLIDLKHQNASTKEKLKQDILATQNVAAKEWLLEKTVS